MCRHLFSVYYPTRAEHISDNCLFSMLHSGTIKNLENPKLNYRIPPILEDTVPPDEIVFLLLSKHETSNTKRYTVPATFHFKIDCINQP